MGTFNDGYHVIHHLHGRLHWSEIPQFFEDHKEQFLQNGAVTFRNIHFFDVGLLVMTGKLRRLVERHYVHLGSAEPAPTVDEVVRKLKTWLEPVPSTVGKVKQN